MRGNAHVRFGGRTGETERSRDRHRAPVRPYYVKTIRDRVRRVRRGGKHVERWAGPSGRQAQVLSDSLTDEVRKVGAVPTLEPSDSALGLDEQLGTVAGRRDDVVYFIRGLTRDLRKAVASHDMREGRSSFLR